MAEAATGKKDDHPAKGNAEGVGDKVVDVELAERKEVLPPFGCQSDGDGQQPDEQVMSDK